MHYSHAHNEAAHKEAEIMAAERGIIDALYRGLLTDVQAMQLLGISETKALEARKKQYGFDDVPEAMREGSIVDGFVNYWQSMNGELE